MENKKCHTMGKVPKSKWKTRNATLSEQFKIPNENKKCHTVGTVPKFKLKQIMPLCRNSARLQVKTNTKIKS